VPKLQGVLRARTGGDTPAIVPQSGTAALDTGSVASEIAVALISGVVGLTTGAIGSLFAPWANWGVEKRRLRRAGRLERISEWRSGVAVLRRAELADGKPQQVAKRASLGDRITERVQYVSVEPDPDLANVQTKPWYGTLRRELSKKTVRQLAELSAQPVQQRLGAIPDRLDEEINRLERDNWKLV
jgi:hypothetical protein